MIFSRFTYFVRSDASPFRGERDICEALVREQATEHFEQVARVVVPLEAELMLRQFHGFRSRRATTPDASEPKVQSNAITTQLQAAIDISLDINDATKIGRGAHFSKCSLFSRRGRSARVMRDSFVRAIPVLIYKKKIHSCVRFPSLLLAYFSFSLSKCTSLVYFPPALRRARPVVFFVSPRSRNR